MLNFIGKAIKNTQKEKDFKLGDSIASVAKKLFEKKIKNNNIAQYFTYNFNTATSNQAFEDGMIDVNLDGENDFNVKYEKDKNGEIIGAEMTSLEGKKVADVDFEYKNGKVSKVSIDNDSDSKNDYTISFETQKDNDGNVKIDSVTEVTYKNGKMTTKKETTYGEANDITSIKETNYENDRKISYEESTFSEGNISNNTYQEFENGKCINEFKSSYQYENGELTEDVTSVYKNGEKSTSTTTKYKNWKPTESATNTYSNGKVVGSSKTTYEYEDGILSYATTKNREFGNIVSETECFYNENGEFSASYPIDYNSKDGIVEFTEQGAIGDCWLLAAINSLKFQNPEVFNDMISYTDNGAIVKFAFAEYEVTDEELKNKKAERQHNATGDDDIIRIEIAMEKMLQDYVDGKIPTLFLANPYNSSTAYYKHGEEKKEEYLIDGGFSSQALYFMTGNQVKVHTNQSFVSPKMPTATLGILAKGMNTHTNNTDNGYLNGLGKNLKSNSVVATCDFKTTMTCKDINGTEIQLHARHAYSIKSITNDTVTIVNPWDGDKEITISREIFANEYLRIETCKMK